RNFKDANPEGLDEAIDIAKKFVVDHSHNYDSIIVGGFSQGAMISSYLCAHLPKVISAIFFSGVLVAQDKLMTLLDGKKSLPFFQSHGKQDPVLSYSEATMLYELLKLYGWQGELVPFDGAHEIPMPVINKASLFLSKFA